MAEIYLMECGHVNNASINGEVGCAICGCTKVATAIDVRVNPTQGLENRQCVCPDCGKVRPSEWTLPFFKYRPECNLDSAYDGCYGWN